jgi:TusA-related sulfurtransferase
MKKEVKLNCLGEVCPVPLIKADKALETIGKDEILVVLLDCSCAVKSISEWARKQNYSVEIEEVSSDKWRCFIEKT